MSEIVLDASALLALLQGEPGTEIVAAHLQDAELCTVNHSEVVAKLADAGMPEQAIREALNLPFRLVDFDATLSMRAGLLRPLTRTVGLSLGDRACLALAIARGATALTAETAWVGIPDGPDVRIIRAPDPKKPRRRARGRAATKPRRG